MSRRGPPEPSSCVTSGILKRIKIGAGKGLFGLNVDTLVFVVLKGKLTLVTSEPIQERVVTRGDMIYITPDEAIFGFHNETQEDAEIGSFQ